MGPAGEASGRTLWGTPGEGLGKGPVGEGPEGEACGGGAWGRGLWEGPGGA